MVCYCNLKGRHNYCKLSDQLPAMKSPLSYHEKYNILTAEEHKLLLRTIPVIRKFIRKSRRISSVHYATRDAHSKSYGYLKGTFLPAATHEAEKFFPNASYEVLVRYSHAHLKIIKTDRQLPVYGLALKIKWNQQEINYPLVNFPVFVTNSVTRFLKLFIGINRFYTAPFILKPYKLLNVGLRVIPILAELMNVSFIKAFKDFMKTFPDFILSRDYHSIGAYRWGDHMIKLKMVPVQTGFKPDKSRFVFENIQEYVSEQPVYYNLYAQFAYDEKFQPVNDLKKQWTATPDVHLGTIELNEVLQDSPDLEKCSFSPFDSPEVFQPVGKIQSLRKAAYEASVQTRNQLNAD